MAAPRNLIGNIGIIVLLNLLTKPLWVVVENLVQDALGHAQWGAYSALNVLALLLAALLELGINQYGTKTLASQPERHTELFPRLLGIKLVSGLLFMALLLAVGTLMGYGGPQLSTLLLVGAIQFVVGLTTFWRAIMQARQDFRMDTLAGIADKTLVTLPVFALLHLGITLHSYLWSLLAVSLLVLLTFGGIAVRRYGIFMPRLDKAGTRHVLQRSMPFAFIAILFLVQERINSLLLERWEGDYAAGLFQGSYRFFAMFQMYLWTVLPIFYAKFAQGYLIRPVEEQNRLFRAGQGIVAVPMIAVCGFLFFYADKLFFLFTHSSPAEVAIMADGLRLLAVALLLNSIFNIYSTYLTATGRERYVNVLLLFAIALNILTTYFLSGSMGPLAAAWGIMLAFALLSAGYVYYVHRVTPLSIHAPTLLRIAGVCALAGGTYWLCAWLHIHWLAAGIAGTTVTLGSGWLLRLLDRKLSL